MNREYKNLIKELNTQENRNQYNKTSEKYVFVKDLLRSINLIGTDLEIDYLEDVFEGLR